MNYRQIKNDRKEIEALSQLATEIVREHFDPIIGKAQNDYMIAKFQSVDAICEQIEHGYLYYMVILAGRDIGFLAVCPKDDNLYLSKFYLIKEERGKGYAKEMLAFVVSLAQEMGFNTITLNVNRNNDAIYVYEKMGFLKIREEKNDIGQGFFMDDYVYEYDLHCFYGYENVSGIKARNNLYKGIVTPTDLYDALSGIWCADTCAPRMREEWSEDNKTLGQCSITAFLAQDIFGGEVKGMPTESGGVHCYNVVDGIVFDLTSEQYKDKAKDLIYAESDLVQERESAGHFGKEEKRQRYEYLRQKLADLNI